MRRGRRKGASKDKVFGCDLLEHLAASSQEIPQVLRSCSEFIEEYGIVDGIYRLSGVSSNTQKLRGEFDVEGVPDLSKEVYRQDIHCVSSLCKAYFRELPNPLLTYQLYDKFADAVAVQLEEERLVKIKEVLKDLPLPHYRTLEYLMRHLVKMATFASQTNMHARNLAIVWAPNLLRSKDIEATGLNGTAAFMEVRVQSIVVEFILTHVSQVFSSPGHTPERRQSLPSPSIMSNQEEPFFRAIPLNVPSALGPGNGPPAMRSYHAIIEGTDKRKGSLKGRKWKSIFNLGGRLQDPRRKNKSPCKEKEQGSLRPAKSMDSLSSLPYMPEGTRQHPSLSPLTQPSPTLGREAGSTGGVLGGAVGGASSGYAVTYRRGGGACVSVVSGGGVQGTYSRLDSGEANEGSLPPQPRSPGITSRAERRAGMHISGPFSVTVPLHITSGLALGVLQGGGHKEEGGAQREEDGAHKEEGGAHREEDGAHKGEGGAHREEGGAHREEGRANKEEGGSHREANGGSHAEEGREGRTAEERKRDKSREDEVEGKKTEVNRSEEGSGEEGRGEEGTTEGFSVEETEPEEEALAEEDQDYMDMRRVFPLEDSQLPLDFQDTFGFLDLMDSSTYNQANEFSVEPPCYEEEDDYEEEFGYQGDAPSIVTLELPAQLPLTHRPLTSDPHGHPCKSHSLPYKSRPFQPARSSTSSSEDEEDEEEGSDEEDMLFYSLPSSLQFHAAKGGEEDAHKMADADARPAAGLPAQQELNTNASTSRSINAISSVNASGQSEGELDGVDGDWLVVLAKPGEIGDDGTEEEDSLELKKKMEEEGETPENTASGESVQAVALTDTNGLGCGEGESGFAVSEDQEEYEDHCGPEQSERDHTAEHSATEQSERDHAAEHSATELSERDHTAEHRATEQSERDHTAEHSATECKERDHAAEHHAREQSKGDHTAEPSTTEHKERDHAVEHNATECKERDHAAEHSATEQSKGDHTAEPSTTEHKERAHVAEHSTTEPKERDHTAEQTPTEHSERDHAAEPSTTEHKERDHAAAHSTTEPKERDHTAEQTPTEHSERDHAAEPSTTEHKERDHAAAHSAREQNERDHTAEHPEPKERDHAAELSTTEHRERLHNDTGPESTAESHHGSPEDPEGCHGDSVSGTKAAAELMECSESPEPCPLPLPEPPWGPHTCAHLFPEPPTTTPGEQEDTCREEGGERELEGGREGGGEDNTESHNQLDVQEKEKRKEKREESQERKVTSGGPEEGRGERDLRTEGENVQKHEAQVNERERDEERSKGGEEDRGQGATQGRSAREEGRREGRSPVVGPSVARKLVRSKQVTPKLQQAKAVPVVPPKPQLCKLTALSLRQQRERERGREGAGDRDGERAPTGDGEKEEQRRGEAEREKGGEGEEENQGEVERLGEDGRSVEKETKRNSGVSVCFDVAVARATERRGRERERGKDGQVDGRRGAEKD
ncbi:uncharacterized protein si:dkeyp-68b7.12 [Anguilla anguilla]|uniref:uncharacterized protein si:dkeyp-68b7.12 n=1 Tax=Anguilla anguilla TaxID=7936 RepID=UPI0015AF4561|nr:uncharacterized protein si:dkeyp-68b7.12 [Anguilla anguilla]XP_035286156.1 uncharacterized protein si:dkeyp-68b7.12 [Anguilla anguilla]XP_035286157.1 uncharacterized protein si:dkeyp-68b7.12 [Anguilla anguilla]XP_035286158.1 uncharacterized protein si:dkeyp-68b7.12 [Anguilla anguilla]